MPKLRHLNSGPAVTFAMTERLAVNLFDLDRIDPLIRECIGLAAKLEPKAIVVDRERPDETAVAFACDLLTAACLLDTIREHDRRAGDHPCRAYVKRGGAWERLPADAVLTEVVGEKVTLSPRWFKARIKGGGRPRGATPPVKMGEKLL